MIHVAQGPWLLAVLNGLVLVVALGVASYVLVGGSTNRADTGESWCQGTRALAQEVQRAAEAGETPADPDRVARRLQPLASRIQGHVRSAPASVDAGTYRALFELGMACQRVAVEQRPSSRSANGVFLEDRLESLRADAAALEDTVRSG